MAGRRGGSYTAEQRYWAARVRSPAFKRALIGMLEGELRALANARIGDVLEREAGPRLIRRWRSSAVDRAAIAELALDVNRRLTRRLARRRDSLLELLDPALVAELDAVFEQFARLTPRGEEFIALLMGQEFMRGLFTDLIYSALVSFYRRVDPLFGGLGVRVLEPQIKSFINYFMPIVQARAAAFATAPANQRIAAAFARAIARQLLARLTAPLGRARGRRSASVDGSVRARSGGQRQVGRPRATGSAGRWDELYAAIAPRKVGDLLGLDAQALRRAERAVDTILPALARPAVLAFIGAEVAGRAQRANRGVPAREPRPRHWSQRRARSRRRARRGALDPDDLAAR